MNPKQLLAEADRCVKCGYCLPHCPTYALKADEGESPRGRIALIQALVSGTVDSKRLHAHLNSCLACRACEAACPSDVRYGQMITSVRKIQRDNKAPSLINKAILHTLSHAPYSQPMSNLAGIYQKFGLASVANILGGDNIARLNRFLPDHIETAPWKTVYPPTGAPIGRVGLFTGCISRITDRAALDAGIRILNQIGYEVLVPSDQGCCGAMHLHSGDSDTADDMARRNHAAFSGLGLDAVVGVASGCTAHIKGQPQENDLSALMMDISAFLCDTPEIQKLKLKPLDKKVAVHTPCSMKNVLKQASAPFLLLKLIPGIKLIELPDNGLCCGAAGLYLMDNPQESDALRADKIDGLKTCQAEILLTSNTGCALHLAAGIRAAGMDVEIMHPVELLARQIST